MVILEAEQGEEEEDFISLHLQRASKSIHVQC